MSALHGHDHSRIRSMSSSPLQRARRRLYSLPPINGRLVIGVGAFTPDAAEIAAATVLNSDVFVDDPAGARHEAGDLIQAGIDWNKVRPLAEFAWHSRT